MLVGQSLLLGLCSSCSDVSRSVVPAPTVEAAESNPTQSDPQPERADVVVVGAGISGLTAALELARGGASVTLVDMSSVFGGHAVMSQGSLSIAGSPVQESAGQHDTPEIAYKDIITFGEDADAEWARFYFDHSKELIYDWVTDLGVRFEGARASPGNSVPREHQPVGRGIGLVTPIFRACQEQPNIAFAWNTQVERLLQKDGRVSGVAGRNLRDGKQTEFSARAVILATGGFQSNLDMVREFWPAEFRFPDRIFTGSGRHSIGLGHALAQSVGGDLARMDHQWNYFTGIPDPRYPGGNRGLSAANMYGIIVNSDAQRFANLHGWAKAVMPPLLKQNPATLWWIFDEASKPKFVVSGSDWADFRKVDREILQDPSLVKSADTLEELAEKAGLPAENLVATVHHWNELVMRGVDEDFGRFGPQASEWSNGASPKIETPPFYAMQSWPLTRKSMGGVAIDRQCRVLDKPGRPIAGLYAVCELTGLAGLNGKAALEGTFLGPCIVTGRVAAREILASLQIAPNADPADGQRCADCHDIESEISSPRPGYWHFEAVHRRVLERSIDCRQCHAELTPYDEDHHRIHYPSLTATCFQCHTARE
jgi:succinate dehydrogenase/fumarate reductase flavoprotein subunit